MTKSSIQNIMFDLGGVIIDICRDHCVDALHALGLANADDVIGLYVQTGAFQQLERGQITTEEFCQAVRGQIPDKSVTDLQVKHAIEQFITGIPVQRLQQLRELRKHYRLFVLSNTNPLLFEGRIKSEFAQEGLTTADYFDGLALSYKAKCTKPDVEIFDYAAHVTGADPAHTLFLDDGQTNVDAAIAYGYQAALIPPGTEFADKLKALDLI